MTEYIYKTNIYLSRIDYIMRMTSAIFVFGPVIRRLERHATKLNDEETDLLAVVRGFDFIQ